MAPVLFRDRADLVETQSALAYVNAVNILLAVGALSGLGRLNFLLGSVFVARRATYDPSILIAYLVDRLVVDLCLMYFLS